MKLLSKTDVTRMLLVFCNKYKNSSHFFLIIFCIIFCMNLIAPIPSEVVLHPLMNLNKNKLYQILGVNLIAIAFAGSILFWIGNSFECFPLHHPNIDIFLQYFHSNCFILIIFFCLGLLPFKILCLCCGFFHLNFSLVFCFMIIGRGLRFFLLAFFLKKYGQDVLSIIGRFCKKIYKQIYRFIIKV